MKTIFSITNQNEMYAAMHQSMDGVAEVLREINWRGTMYRTEDLSGANTKEEKQQLKAECVRKKWLEVMGRLMVEKPECMRKLAELLVIPGENESFDGMGLWEAITMLFDDSRTYDFFLGLLRLGLI